MDIRNIMDTVQEVALAFKFSAKRVLDFEEQLMNNAAVREEMGRQSKLKVLCETRWASRADSLNVFVSSLQASSLSIIQLQWHQKAQNATSEHNVRREIVLINGPPCA